MPPVKNPNYWLCDVCERILRVEDGPVCADCQAKTRSEAARRAAETRRESAEASQAADRD